MITIIDYGAGNIKSLQFALEKLELESILTTDPDEIKKARAIILPGVGAFEDAMLALKNANLVHVIQEEVTNGKPLLGICLGMQLLYETSSEGGISKGLGLIEGKIERITDTVKVPHMGWNTLSMKQNSTIVKHVEQNAYVYFVHSYYASEMNASELVCSTAYGIEVPAIIQKDNIIGMQFHPEKSGKVGIQLLKNFGGMVS
ncbi:glutamine amidotransferase [Oceanobacillus limi]|uniref:Imidazole glycerol phosphate synthase subunit HisH n=1 Tax=Oceanobacillus limi TaxID=930131 RepID=A0A1I0AVH6_9BACI|nr:imidazole glycerol phosphate synthase subunit HisH [Oceanobacillus limi]SES98456.1 glutamine amidotransferase [Oceanobacillus limi]